MCLNTASAAFVMQLLVRTKVVNELCYVCHLVQLLVWWMLILQKSLSPSLHRDLSGLADFKTIRFIFIAVWFYISVLMVMKVCIVIMLLQVIQFCKIYKILVFMAMCVSGMFWLCHHLVIKVGRCHCFRGMCCLCCRGWREWNEDACSLSITKSIYLYINKFS